MFSFHHDNSPCCGFEEFLSCYRKYDAAESKTMETPASNGVCRLEARSEQEQDEDGETSSYWSTRQEQEITVQTSAVMPILIPSRSLAPTREYCKVQVGDGPREDMQKFDDKLTARDFDKFEFVNFTSIMSRNTMLKRESAFVLEFSWWAHRRLRESCQCCRLFRLCRGSRGLYESRRDNIFSRCVEEERSRIGRKRNMCAVMGGTNESAHIHDNNHAHSSPTRAFKRSKIYTCNLDKLPKFYLVMQI
ncbi:hypothetical protein EJB05_46829, partial [Eragrostis curvula]